MIRVSSLKIFVVAMDFQNSHGMSLNGTRYVVGPPTNGRRLVTGPAGCPTPTVGGFPGDVFTFQAMLIDNIIIF